MVSIILKNYFRKACKHLLKKAEWEFPKENSKIFINKIIKYDLKSGGHVEIKKNSFIINYFWKYAKPIKYYFIKLQAKANKLKHKELENKSKKWHIKKII